MINYRKIYEQKYGPIPRDTNGRSYEIHHIDGNHSNDSPENLVAVTIQEHYDIHYSQGDWAACSLIANKMKLSPLEISLLCSKLAKKHNQQRIKNGTHHLLRRVDGTSHATDRIKNGTHNFQTRPNGTNLQIDKVISGTHHFLGGEIQKRLNRLRVDTGTHNFLGPETNRKNNKKRIENNTHHFLGEQEKVKCPYCLKEGGIYAMKRWHFDKCKVKNKSVNKFKNVLDFSNKPV